MKSFVCLLSELLAVASVVSATTIPKAHKARAAVVEDLDARAPTPAGPYPPVITSCVNPMQAAVTLDDGPYDYLQEISDYFTWAGGKATFFFNGNNWRCIYTQPSQDLVKYAYQNGHQIASHTWAHLNLTQLTYDEIHSEMRRVEQALQRIIGVTPAIMRPPFGAYNDLVRRVARERGQSVVTWDFDSGDSTGATVDQSKQRYEDALGKHPSNLLALNHETKQPTAHQIIPWVVKLLKYRGYQLVTVAQCLNVEPYQKITAPQTPSPSWQC
ncbi:chitin deacetylase [Cantharellus anzutake]|uniref:chitin deacetylase n=1 Tax=Cantharellus anzutake TaxID=1750568 RepID=UPI00190305F6|nr:chitin deacetylase [Cantharellus anzutake]KAF8335846.1 chitin deacetylase [Cantharellus anzutake]